MEIQVLVFAGLSSPVLPGGQVDRLVFCLLITDDLTFDHRLLIRKIQIESIGQIDLGDARLCNAVDLVRLLHGYSGALVFVHLLADEQLLQGLVVRLAVVWFGGVDSLNVRLDGRRNRVMVAQPATPFHRIVDIELRSHQALVVSRVHHSDRVINRTDFT